MTLFRSCKMAVQRESVLVLVIFTFVAGMLLQKQLQQTTIIYNTDNEINTHVTFSRQKEDNIPNKVGQFVLSNTRHKSADRYTTIVTTSPRPITVKRFTKVNSGPIYLFGAVVKNSTKRISWDTLSVYGMVNTTTFPNTTKFQCCLLHKHNHKDTRIYKVSPNHMRLHWAEAEMRTYHFTCINVLHWRREIPAFVGISVAGIECGTTSEQYVEPRRSFRQPKTTLAISTQVAYGSANAELIIEWIESYRYLGVDKIVSYFTANINQDALDVLVYYHNLRVIDLFYYIPAAEDILPRQFNDSSFQTFNDLIIVNHDAFEMMSGYTYFGVIDFDEFLIPAKNMKLKHMLKKLFKSKRDAAAFKFMAKYHYLSWGPTGFYNNMILGRYLNTTEFGPILDKEKMIYKPEAVTQGGISTHNIKPKKHLQLYTVPEDVGYIRHYRNCRTRNETVHEQCMNTYNRVQDTFMAKWSSRIEQRVHHVRTHVFGSEDPR